MTLLSLNAIAQAAIPDQFQGIWGREWDEGDILHREAYDFNNNDTLFYYHSISSDSIFGYAKVAMPFFNYQDNWIRAFALGELEKDFGDWPAPIWKENEADILNIQLKYFEKDIIGLRSWPIDYHGRPNTYSIFIRISQTPDSK